MQVTVDINVFLECPTLMIEAELFFRNMGKCLPSKVHESFKFRLFLAEGYILSSYG
jgi:hypothetical protein